MTAFNHLFPIILKRSVHFSSLLVIFSFCFLFHFFLDHEFNIIYDWIVNYIDLLMFNSAVITFFIFYLISPVSFENIRKEISNQKLQQYQLLGIFLCLVLLIFGLQLNLIPSLAMNKLFSVFSIGFIFFDFLAHIVLFKTTRKNTIFDIFLDSFLSVFILFLFFGSQTDFLYSSFVFSFFLRLFFEVSSRNYLFILFYFVVCVCPFVFLTGVGTFGKNINKDYVDISIVIFLISNLMTYFWLSYNLEKQGEFYARRT